MHRSSQRSPFALGTSGHRHHPGFDKTQLHGWKAAHKEAELPHSGWDAEERRCLELGLPGAEINSVAVHDGLVAVAVQAALKTDPGRVALFRAADLALLGSATVGAQPDMITFTPDGRTVLLANEGEPSDDYQTDPVGSISIVDVSAPAAPMVRTADFSAFNAQKTALLSAGVRIYGPNASVAQDLEPEYIAVSADGRTAWATLQENNAFAKIDIASATVTDILPLGFKDHGVAGNELDASDTDGGTINIRTWPGVRGLYLPDSIASYSAGGQTYLVTANEATRAPGAKTTPPTGPATPARALSRSSASSTWSTAAAGPAVTAWCCWCRVRAPGRASLITVLPPQHLTW